jgi:hypothetical protein
MIRWLDFAEVICRFICSVWVRQHTVASVIDTPKGALYIGAPCAGPIPRSPLNAQVAELVDALVSGISGEIRGGSSPLLGTTLE